MQLITTILFLLSALTARTFAYGSDGAKPKPTATGRPCGFKIAPCPTSQSCKPTDSTCTRGENCAGTCVNNRISSVTSFTSSTLTTLPSPKPATYAPCGGHRVEPLACKSDYICVDDPYVGGCGMSCDVRNLSCYRFPWALDMLFLHPFYPHLATGGYKKKLSGVQEIRRGHGIQEFWESKMLIMVLDAWYLRQTSLLWWLCGNSL
jgi:hypothetical protein